MQVKCEKKKNTKTLLTFGVSQKRDYNNVALDKYLKGMNRNETKQANRKTSYIFRLRNYFQLGILLSFHLTIGNFVITVLHHLGMEKVGVTNHCTHFPEGALGWG